MSELQKHISSERKRLLALRHDPNITLIIKQSLYLIKTNYQIDDGMYPNGVNKKEDHICIQGFKNYIEFVFYQDWTEQLLKREVVR